MGVRLMQKGLQDRDCSPLVLLMLRGARQEETVVPVRRRGSRERECMDRKLRALKGSDVEGRG